MWGAESAADSLFMIKRSSRVPVLAFRGTEGSNPVCSTGESGELRNRVAAGGSRELMVVSNEGNIGRAARIPLLQRRSRIAANGS